MPRVGRTDMNAIAEGEGPPVLFLHGNPESLWAWRGVIDRMKSSYRCHAFDLPGFGASHAPKDLDVSLQAQADFVAGGLDAVGVREPVHLVVHDVGGYAGLAFAVNHPDRVRTIGITNTSFHSDYKWHFWGRVWRTPVLGEITNALGTYGLFRREVKKGTRNLTEQQIADTWKRFTPEAKKMVLRLYRAMSPKVFAGWEDRLLAVTARVPTRVIWGVHDPYISGSYADRFGTTDVHRLDDIGHWVAMEAPDRLATLLGELFARG